MTSRYKKRRVRLKNHDRTTLTEYRKKKFARRAGS